MVQGNNSVLIEEFAYPSSEAPATLIWPDIPTVDREPADRTVPENLSQMPIRNPEESHDRFSLEHAEETRRSFEAGRSQGIEEGRQLEAAEQSVRLRELEMKKIQDVAQIAGQVAEDRDKLLRLLEPEVVKLSLSIASRILRREVQMDPLFLTGAVRVALGQLAQTATVRLRVPAVDAELWSETITHLPNLKVRPAVIGDERMRSGESVLETDMGVADIGVASQLSEIARGLLDIEAAAKTSGGVSTGWKDDVQ